MVLHDFLLIVLTVIMRERDLNKILDKELNIYVDFFTKKKNTSLEKKMHVGFLFLNFQSSYFHFEFKCLQDKLMETLHHVFNVTNMQIREGYHCHVVYIFPSLINYTCKI